MSEKIIRYAVVGLGHIAQAAVLPAFASAKNSRVTALVSGDPKKLEELGRRYEVENRFSYEDYGDLLDARIVDAVYIALPNSMHHSFAKRALERGVHVLCEKPLTTTAAEAEDLVRTAKRKGALLMTAYRLHFEKANLEALELVKSGKIGAPRLFNSTFTFQLEQDNIRGDRGLGGGPLLDLGVYCVNAARSLFRAEPEEVSAFATRAGGRRMQGVEDTAVVLMRFPEDRLAHFAVSFAASAATWYEVVGEKGTICLDQSYEYVEPMELDVRLDEGPGETRIYPKRDQFAPELVYFSDRLLKGSPPEPDGDEGLADLRAIDAIKRSIASGRAEKVGRTSKKRRPSMRQQIRRRPVERAPKLVRAAPASR